MKLIKIISFFLIGILFSACASFLNYEPDGTTVTQEQVENTDGSLDFMLNGVYRIMSQRQTENHNDFGVKGVDVFTDLLTGDMGMSKNVYGWYQDAIYQQLYYSSARFNNNTWAYYFKMLKNINRVIKSAKAIKAESADDIAYRDHALGQALAMRGYVYFNLAIMYGQCKDNTTSALNAKILPFYNEDNDSVGIGPSTLKEVYTEIVKDLEDAIVYLDGYNRPSKVQIDSDIAKGILASVYLQEAYYYSGQDAIDRFTNAKKLAQEVIDAHNFEILTLSNVLTTGFNSIDISSFMWGQDVTQEMTGGLATFWGQVDIYTYSYAYAGDTKQIDKNLYNSIPDSDKRKKWWNGESSYPYAPDGKFYSNTKPVFGGDRIWVNDVHYMRFEEMYLIVAEADYKLGDFTGAYNALKVLLDQRDPTEAAALVADATIGEKILFNWRVELWGEGRALRVLKRINHDFGLAVYTLGDNHMGNLKNKTVNAVDVYYTFETPTSEVNNNINWYK